MEVLLITLASRCGGSMLATSTLVLVLLNITPQGSVCDDGSDGMHHVPTFTIYVYMITVHMSMHVVPPCLAGGGCCRCCNSGSKVACLRRGNKAGTAHECSGACSSSNSCPGSRRHSFEKVLENLWPKMRAACARTARVS